MRPTQPWDVSLKRRICPQSDRRPQSRTFCAMSLLLLTLTFVDEIDKNLCNKQLFSMLHFLTGPCFLCEAVIEQDISWIFRGSDPNFMKYPLFSFSLWPFLVIFICCAECVFDLFVSCRICFPKVELIAASGGSLNPRGFREAQTLSHICPGEDFGYQVES